MTQRPAQVSRVAAALAGICLIAGCALGSGPAGSVSDDALRGRIAVPDGARRTRVVRVVDGDTVVLSGLGSSRMIGVDTPDVHGGTECFGREASAFARRLLKPGATARFVRGEERRDRYGRSLVYLWLEDGRSFNAMLAEGGYAKPLVIAPNDRYAKRFAALARKARRSGWGQWSASTCGTS
jgi:micrococcal nuclease